MLIKKPYNVMGINPGHNGSVAIVSNGELVYYIEEERLSRLKYDGNPFRGMLDAMNRYKIDEVVIGGTTLNLPTLPWTGEDPYSALIRKFDPEIKISNLGDEHHFGHSACAFYNSGFDSCVSVVVDGAGSYRKERVKEIDVEGFETESIWTWEYPAIYNLIKKNYGADHCIKISNDIVEFDNGVSIVKSYEAVSEYLGFGFIDAGKTMGLSSYGKADENIPELFIGGRGNKNLFIPHYPSGAIIDKERYPQFKRNTKPKGWHSDPILLLDIEKNLAWKIQEDTQKMVGDLIQEAIDKTKQTNVTLSGGYALNCVSNYYLKKRFPNINLYIEAISHDGGTSIGLAKVGYYRYISKEEVVKYKQKTLYCGPSYPNQFIEFHIQQYSPDISTKIVTYEDVAKLISEKNIVAMYQGQSEAGPRSLGNRSILYDPRDLNGKDFVNEVKGREWFRPFAGSILAEDANDWFDMGGLGESPFMMYAVNVLPNKVSQIPTITHVDNTCRIQTVTIDQNRNFYNLITEFKKITGVPILFNTSFNLAGEPLVETIIDGLTVLFKSKINYLYLPEMNLLIEKNLKL